MIFKKQPTGSLALSGLQSATEQRQLGAAMGGPEGASSPLGGGGKGRDSELAGELAAQQVDGLGGLEADGFAAGRAHIQ